MKDELRTTSDPSELKRIREFTRAVCRRAPPGSLREEDTDGVELAVNEAAANIMKHAYQGRTDQPIWVEADVSPDRILFRLCHRGGSFDPRSAPATLDLSHRRGYGLYIMSQCMDEVGYSRDEQGRNCTSLTKKMKQKEN